MHSSLTPMIYGFGLIAIGIAWLLPGHYFPWTGFQQDTATAIGALLLALAAIVSTPGRRVPVPAAAFVALALAIVPLLQWHFGKVPFLADAVLSALYIAAFGLTVMAATSLARASPHVFLATFMVVTLVAAVASVVIGLGQWLQLGWLSYVEQMEHSGRVFANFTQPNHLATLLGLGLVASWWLHETGRIGRVGLAALWLPIGFGLVATQSRTGWIFVAMLAAWWALARGRVALRTKPSTVVMSVLAFVAITFAWAPLNAALDMSSATVLTTRVQQLGGRAVHWQMLWDAALREPWSGWGWMQVGAAQNALALDYPRTGEWISFSHNLVLDLLIWNGVVIGGGVCVGIAWWVATRCVRARNANEWASLAAGGVILAHSMVEFPYAYSYFLLPLAIFVGIVDSRTSAPLASMASMPKWLYGVVCLGMAGMLAWICVEYSAIEEASSRTRFQEAGYVTPGSKPQVPDVVLLDNQREFIWFRLTEARPGMTENDLDRMRAISQRFMPPAVLLRYALALGLNRHEAESARQLKLICQLWKDRQCEEGRESWAKAQAKFPQLLAIPYPPVSR